MAPKSKKTKQEAVPEEEEQLAPLELDETETNTVKTRKYVKEVDAAICDKLKDLTTMDILSFLYQRGDDSNSPNHALREGVWRTMRDMIEGEKPRLKMGNRNSRSRSRSRKRFDTRSRSKERQSNMDWVEPIRGRSRTRDNDIY